MRIGVRTVGGNAGPRVSCDAVTRLGFGRELSEVSKLTFTSADPEVMELIPWIHWIDFFDGDTEEPDWSGIVMDRSKGLRSGNVVVEAQDVSVYQWYTRVPVTDRWSQFDTASIAESIWRQMLLRKNIDIEPSVRISPSGDRFDFGVSADSQMINAAMEDLVRLGLEWTVYAGRPILGKRDPEPVWTFKECDFADELTVKASGRRAANDVRLQGMNWGHTQRVEYGGLDLQALVSLDSLFGKSNIATAARQYLESNGRIRDGLTVPQGATLSPDAGIGLDELVPGYWYSVYAQGFSSTLKLRSVSVEYTPDGRSVALSLDAPNTTLDLGTVTAGI